MRPILFDTSAFLCAKKLGLLDLLVRTGAPEVSLCMTEYVARHELSTVSTDIDALRDSGLLDIHSVPARGSPASQNLWKLRREPRVHKGEAEAIAWAMSLPKNERPLFISDDDDARKGSARNRVPAGDLMDLAAEMLLAGITERAELRRLLSVWDDRSQELCRPRDWSGFDSTLERRTTQRGC